METTLYNHRKAGGDKPLIPNIIFKGLMELQDIGDVKACNYLLSCYTLVEAQIKLYNNVQKSITAETPNPIAKEIPKRSI